MPRLATTAATTTAVAIAAAAAALPALATPSAQPAARLLPVQTSECSQRIGPYLTQSRAWEMWRMARAEAARRGPAYAVSHGVVPCHGPGGRGYCFFVFYPC